ncbi:MAG: hypothetical protein WCF85_14295 [Rhodospirillaceae bacterium]
MGINDQGCPLPGPDIFDRSVLDELAEVLNESELVAYLELLDSTVVPRVALLRQLFEKGDKSELYQSQEVMTRGHNG